MARYNEILVGRYARALQKLFGMKGEVPVGSLAGELVASHVVFNGAENRYLEGWERFASSFGPTGGAAQNAAVGFRNPFGSNMLCVVEQIFLWSPQALNCSVQRNFTADLPTVISLTGNRVPDTRQRNSPTIIASTSTNAATTGTTMFSISALANTLVLLINDENQEIPVLPGDGIQLFDNTQVAQLNASFLWRERYLEEAERT